MNIVIVGVKGHEHDVSKRPNQKHVRMYVHRSRCSWMCVYSTRPRLVLRLLL